MIGFGLASGDLGATAIWCDDQSNAIVSISISTTRRRPNQPRRIRLPGRHNIANAMAAAAAALAIGIEPKRSKRALADFSRPAASDGIRAERGGVTYIDDSKGTNVGAVVEALAAIARAGHSDRGRSGQGRRLRAVAAAARGKGQAADSDRCGARQDARRRSTVRPTIETGGRRWPRRSTARRRAARRRRHRAALAGLLELRSIQGLCGTWATYFRSWFGRFEAVSYRRPDPWLWLPAAALLVLGLLMVLNTTYFLGQREDRRRVPFFQASSAAISRSGLRGAGAALAILAARVCAGW